MAELTLMELQMIMFFWYEMLEDKEEQSVVLANQLFSQCAMVLVVDNSLERAKVDSLKGQIKELDEDISTCLSLYESLHRLYEPWAHLVHAAAERAARNYA
jgi:hypothetical protein